MKRNILLYLDVISHSIPYDKLSEKGIKAKQFGGHEGYKKWEEEQERRKNIEEFPKKKWYYYDTAKIVVGKFLGFLLKSGCDYIVNQSKSREPSKSNTLKSSPPSPKTSNKKDSL